MKLTRQERALAPVHHSIAGARILPRYGGKGSIKWVMI
jgi:hypothetical protein